MIPNLQFVEKGSDEERSLQLTYYHDRIKENERIIITARQKIKDAKKDLIHCRREMKKLQKIQNINYNKS